MFKVTLRLGALFSGFRVTLCEILSIQIEFYPLSPSVSQLYSIEAEHPNVPSDDMEGHGSFLFDKALKKQFPF